MQRCGALSGLAGNRRYGLRALHQTYVGCRQFQGPWLAARARSGGLSSTSRLQLWPRELSSGFVAKQAGGDGGCKGGPPCDAKQDVRTLEWWRDGAVWRASAHNTKWCLAGCSAGEFATLMAYSHWDVADWAVAQEPMTYYFLLGLPLINGLATSVGLEWWILVRAGMPRREALSTAMGMSFISMLVMEAAMEATDLWFTAGALGLSVVATPCMLVAGFLAPWPYNYWRLKLHGAACH